MNTLYRSRRDSMITGLCGGLAEKMRIDSNLLRVIVAVTAFFSVFTLIPIYIIASIVIPKEPLYNPYDDDSTYRGSGYGSPYHSNYNQYSNTERHYKGQSNNRQRTDSPIDDMMSDLEKKAMKKEIEELRARLAKLEKEER